MTLLQRWRQTALHNKALVWTGALVAFGTVFYAFAVAFQIKLMKTGSEETTKQITRLIGAADRIAEDMKESVEQAKLLIRTGEVQARTGLEASTKQSRAALDASVEISRRDQRAWLTVNGISLSKPLAVGERVLVVIRVVNTGKTPAADTMVAGTVLSRRTLAEALSGRTEGNPDSRIIIGPNDAVTIPLDTSGPVTNQGQIDAISTGEWQLYAVGYIIYTDIFAAEHTTRFCFKADSEVAKAATAKWRGCAEGNSID